MNTIILLQMLTEHSTQSNILLPSLREKQLYYVSTKFILLKESLKLDSAFHIWQHEILFFLYSLNLKSIILTWVKLALTELKI